MASRVSFITGGGGFIGSHLCRVLADRGDRVHVLSRTKSLGWRLRGLEDDLRVHRGDVTDAAGLMKIIGQVKPDYVFHLAAAVDVRRDPLLFPAMINVNLQGTKNVFNACKGRVKRVIHAGTCEEYGNIPAPFKESDRESPVSPYSWSKVVASQLAQMWHRTMGFPVVVARPFLTYGPLQNNDMFIPSLIRACLLKKEFKMTKGLQTRELNYVADIVNGLAELSEAKNVDGEIINIGCGREYKIRDVARLVWELCGTKNKLRIGALPYRPGEAMHFYSSTAKARKKLHWRPITSLETGLWATIDWYRGYLETKS